MLRFFQLLLRPFQRFFAQWIAVSTAPTAFVREHVRLGDTTNFLRAISCFFSAISTAFLAEVATLYLLGIGGLAEPYYWLFILLTSIPFVLFCFLLVRLVAPLSFKDLDRAYGKPPQALEHSTMVEDPLAQLLRELSGSYIRPIEE